MAEKQKTGKAGALFIDFENLFKPLYDEFKNYTDRTEEISMVVVFKALSYIETLCDKIPIKYAFADWSNYQGRRDDKRRVAASREFFPRGIRAVNIKATDYKNSADLELSLSLHEVLLTRDDIDIFFVIAGDRDYMPIALRVIERGKEIYFISFEAGLADDLKKLVGSDHYIIIDITGERMNPDGARIDDKNRDHSRRLTALESVLMRSALKTKEDLGGAEGGIKVLNFLQDVQDKVLPNLELNELRNIFESIVAKGFFHIVKGPSFLAFTIGKGTEKPGPASPFLAEILEIPIEEWNCLLDTITECLTEGEGRALKGKLSIFSAYFRRKRMDGLLTFRPSLELDVLLLLAEHGVLAQKDWDVFHLGVGFLQKREEFLSWLDAQQKAGSKDAVLAVSAATLDNADLSVQIEVPNELRSITLSRGEWIAFLNFIERCISEAGGSDRFQNILYRIEHEREEGSLPIKGGLAIPLVNTLRFHELIYQPEPNYYALPGDFPAKRATFFRKFNIQA
ncbi:MAG: NYN domain-containing protein [Candidatus Lokiarchaeota archaeon]|nr:NYN domain-containing protein [Candidatus Lokiarchaeota archaeon]